MADLDQGSETTPKRTGRDESRLAVVIVLTILGTVFAVENLDRTEVNYVFGTGHPRMIFVIVACIGLGVALGWFASKRRAGRTKD
jgi:uncharacterized integral membrane protein